MAVGSMVIAATALAGGASPPPPVNATAPIITGTAQVGQSLTCSDGTWTNNPTSFAYQWKRGGLTILGATASGYLVTTDDIGAQITCTVTATNGGGASAATSTAVVPIALTETPPPATGDTTAPTLTSFKINRHKFPFPEIWTINGKPVKHGAIPKYSFALNEAATVKISLTAIRVPRKDFGEAVGGATNAQGVVGPNTVRFRGKFGQKYLARGKYQATAVATDDAGNISAPVTLTFSIVRQKIRR